MGTRSSLLMAVVIAGASCFSSYAQTQSVRSYQYRDVREVPAMRSLAREMPEGSRLDDSQREAIQKIQSERLKESTQTRNQLNEKYAKLEALQTSDKPDMNEINKMIDEISGLQAKEMKAQAESRQKIRGLLTEEQRILYDAGRWNLGVVRATPSPQQRRRQ